MKPDLTSAVGRLLEDTYKEAYRAGLRRAQELAKEHAEARSFIDGTRADIDWSAADQAIDAEAAKERT